MSAVLVVPTIRYLRFAVFSIALLPALAFADFCDILTGIGAPSCRMNAEKMGASIFGSWLRIKPESAQSSSGKKGYFVSGTTVTVSTLGTTQKGKFKLTTECFAGERSMTIQAMPYMLGLTNGGIKAFDLTFKVDNKSKFTETWPINWKHSVLQAPQGSRLATVLQGARDLVVITEGVIGQKSQVGYVYKVDGFDQMNLELCK
jgi:hypothetical protein